jgi:hypothetical protein
MEEKMKRILVVVTLMLFVCLLFTACSQAIRYPASDIESSPASDIESSLQNYVKGPNEYLVAQTVNDQYIALPTKAVTDIKKNRITIASGTQVAIGSYTKSGSEKDLAASLIKNLNSLSGGGFSFTQNKSGELTQTSKNEVFEKETVIKVYKIVTQ